jgi:hypothetical protein
MTFESCKPYKYTETAIAHRGLTILRHLQTMREKNGVDPALRDPILSGKIDMDNIALIGHSRGGEAVVSAYDLNKGIPLADQFKIKAVASIAPTDFRAITIDVPYLVMIGSDDEDVIDCGGIRIYDRAAPPKHMVWVIGAIHNCFSSNWYWPDEVSAEPPVTRAHHQDIAKGYCNIFFHEHIKKNVMGLPIYMTGQRALPSLGGVELHHSFQTTGGLKIDNFEDAPVDKTHNSMGQLVADTSIRAFNEKSLHRHTIALPLPVVPADVISGVRSMDGCTINEPSWFHDTNGLLVEWDTTSAIYTSQLASVSALPYTVLSFRVAQDTHVNAPGANQDLKVTLTDSGGQVASVKVSEITTVPFPRSKMMGAVSFTKSVMKTVRIPLTKFKEKNASLNLGTLTALRLEFSERPRGKLGFDDFEFTR